MDFRLETFRYLLNTIKECNFSFQPFFDFFNKQKDKTIILRHDVDRQPRNSLNTALIEHRLGICGSYYFRIVSESFNETVICKIAELGHEIGYHYEDLSLTGGNIDKAYDSFCCNLERLNKIYPIKTICMHGSPMSKWDSRNIWRKYNYKELGISAEPYFDINFNEVFYITDTGRRWNGERYSIRDKPMQRLTTQWPSYRSTFDIMSALNNGTFPNTAMITIHPQRWSDNYFDWAKELLFQNIKNQAKIFLVKNY
jgi:hypothetical protein